MYNSGVQGTTNCCLQRARMHMTIEELRKRCCSEHYAIFKGIALERCAYGAEKMRPVGDIDILVSACSAERLHDALVDMGYRQYLGPSSARKSNSRAYAAVWVSRSMKGSVFMNTEQATVPLRRRIESVQFAPYWKANWPTVELHDGIRGIATAQAQQILTNHTTMDGNMPVLNAPAQFAVLILTAYQNSEMFPSNSYDYSVRSQDYDDICAFIRRYFGNKSFWDDALRVIRNVDAEQRLSTVIGNFSELFPSEALPSHLASVGCSKSRWGSIHARLANPARTKDKTILILRNVLQNHMKASDTTGSVYCAAGVRCSVEWRSEGLLVKWTIRR